MKKSIAILFVFAVVFGFSMQAQADVSWDWNFPQDNLYLFPDDTLYIGGTLNNSSSSTEALVVNAYSWWVSDGDLDNSDFDGDVYEMHLTSFDQSGIFPNSNEVNVYPGSSYDFTMGNFTPVLSVPIGTSYTWTVVLYRDFDGPNEESISHNLNVSIVPEPISSTLFLIGGAVLGFRRFRKSTKVQ